MVQNHHQDNFSKAECGDLYFKIMTTNPKADLGFPTSGSPMVEGMQSVQGSMRE